MGSGLSTSCLCQILIQIGGFSIDGFSGICPPLTCHFYLFLIAAKKCHDRNLGAEQVLV